MLSAEERRELLTALRALPPRQREALALKYYLDLPDQQIADAMGIGQSRQSGATSDASTFANEVLWVSPPGDELIVGNALRNPNPVAALTASHLTLLPAANQPGYPAIVW